MLKCAMRICEYRLRYPNIQTKTIGTPTSFSPANDRKQPTLKVWTLMRHIVTDQN